MSPQLVQKSLKSSEISEKFFNNFYKIILKFLKNFLKIFRKLFPNGKTPTNVRFFRFYNLFTEHCFSTSLKPFSELFEIFSKF